MHLRVHDFVAVAFLTLLPVSLCSCATGPSRAHLYVSPEFNDKIAAVSNFVIVADFCIVRDAVGKPDYVCLEESQTAQDLAAGAAREHLRKKDYEVETVLTPFIGSFRDGSRSFEVAEKVGAPVIKMIPPYRMTAALKDDSELREALRQTIACATYAFDSGGPTNPVPAEVEQASRALLPVVIDRTGADMALVLIGSGRIVPMGKQIAQGVGTGLVTAALTLGFVSVARWDVSYLDTWAAMVDLRSGQVLWSNSARVKNVNPAEKDYLKMWTYETLYHFPSNPKSPARSPPSQ